MYAAASSLRERAVSITKLMKMDQGKPLFEARGELAMLSDIIEWFAC